MRHLPEKSLLEVLLLSNPDGVSHDQVCARFGYKVDVASLIDEIKEDYADRSLIVAEILPGKWAIRTKPEHSDLCREMLTRPIRISRAGYETLAVIAYFQPVTRPEIERVRGVALSPGTLEVLIYRGFVKLGPRRATAGNPMTFMTTERFLTHFNLPSLDAMPGYLGMKEQGLLAAEKGISFPERASD